jgi:hypothetical protein
VLTSKESAFPVFLILGIKVSAEGDLQFYISSGLQNKLLPKVQVDVYVLVKDRRCSAVDIIACGRSTETQCFSEKALLLFSYF